MKLSRRTFGGALAAVAADASAVRAQPRGKRSLPPLWVTLEAAEVRASGTTLTVDTGAVVRTWQWTGKGLVTTSLKNSATGRDWTVRKVPFAADWNYEGMIGADTGAKLKSLRAAPVRFDPLSSDHIAVVAEIEYPAANLSLQYEVRAYPGAPGVWTRLRVKGLAGYAGSRFAALAHPRCDYVPAAGRRLQRRAIGYYNHTQRRNTRETEILREEVRAEELDGEETYDWANILCLEDGEEGICLVKESHKCVNQTGVNTGDFRCGKRGLENTGWGPSPADILTSRYRDCWAGWAIVYGGSDGRETAIKTFDRMRYPVDPRRDIYIMANTWGSGGAKTESLEASREENVLRQIESCQDLGIDVQQIDDGWQGNQYKKWAPAEERYPDGWKRVRRAAREMGVKLGLWAAWVIDSKALLKTFDDGGFNYYKIDFAKLDTYEKLEALMSKMRGLVRHSGNTVRVNWDVTENPPRVGYYFARELGNIYLENRKTMSPAQVVYVPYLVLRDAWQVAHYTNLNRFQITVQNIDRVNRDASNAHLYNHPYCVAATLMGSPIFFQETTYYSPEAREQIRPLLAVYRKHRRRMYRGYVYPIGAKPDDGSWTGFQNHDAAAESGYLTVFRELRAVNYRQSLPLRFVGGKKIRLRNLMSGEAREIKVPVDGQVSFEINQSPGFQFLRYEVA